MATPTTTPKPAPPMFETEDEVAAELLAFYRRHASRLSGLSEATTKLWPRLVKRMPRKVLMHLAQLGLSHKARTLNGHELGRQGWTAAQGSIIVQQTTPSDPAQAGKPVRVRVERLPWTGPTQVFPRILTTTLYATKTVVKPLLRFSMEDFQFVMTGFAEQRNGLERRIEAMSTAVEALRAHQVREVADLPTPEIEAFAARWEEALRSERGPARVVA
jgi:hypothetical protein